MSAWVDCCTAAANRPNKTEPESAEEFRLQPQAERRQCGGPIFGNSLPGNPIHPKAPRKIEDFVGQNPPQAERRQCGEPISGNSLPGNPSNLRGVPAKLKILWGRV
jgi:hypothetical protein